MIQRYRLKEVVREKLLTHNGGCLSSFCAVSLHLTFSIERQPSACLFGLFLNRLAIKITLRRSENYFCVDARVQVFLVLNRQLQVFCASSDVILLNHFVLRNLTRLRRKVQLFGTEPVCLAGKVYLLVW